MQYNTFSVLFIIRKTKLLRSKKAPLFIRITVNGMRCEFATGRSIIPETWDSIKCRAKGSSREIREFNNYLDEFQSRVFQAKKQLESDFKPVTPENIKNILTCNNEQYYYLLDKLREHINELNLLIGKGFTKTTIGRYNTAYKHLYQFIKKQYNKEDVLFSDIDHSFLKKFELYMKTDGKCTNNTFIKYLKNLKKIVRIALANGWIKTDPFGNMTYHIENVETVYLDENELNLLLTKEIEIPRIAQIRDMFVFCCFTGLAFSDVSTLKKENLVKGMDGKIWLQKRRVKTDVLSNLPLMEIPLEILNKYAQHPACVKKGNLLPIPSNQKTNAYLKEIADLCGINKNLTTHAARHTFATTVTLANHVSMESVSKMLGHTSINMTRKYARIVDKLISEDMNKLEGKYSYKKAM